MKILSSIDLVGNTLSSVKLGDATILNIAAHPASPLPGQIDYLSATNVPYYYDNSAWRCLDATKIVGGIPIAALVTDPLARANHTGTQAAATISDFESAASSVASSVVSAALTTVTHKYAVNVGNGTDTSIVITHNLNTRDVVISLQDAATYEGLLVDWVATSVNTITLTFASAPATDAYRITVAG